MYYKVIRQRISSSHNEADDFKKFNDTVSEHLEDNFELIGQPFVVVNEGTPIVCQAVYNGKRQYNKEQVDKIDTGV